MTDLKGKRSEAVMCLHSPKTPVTEEEFKWFDLIPLHIGPKASLENTKATQFS